MSGWFRPSGSRNSKSKEQRIALIVGIASGATVLENTIGEYGFGVVFKGTINGQPVAVKRLIAIDTERLKEYDAEIDVLGKLRHCNLVQLLGYCIHGSERLLVYEYMASGSLREHLKQRGHPPLTWEQRVTIALDIAWGDSVYSQHAHESFIHRDLKPANILLDKDLRAKVADFGLIRPAVDKDRVKVAGLFGYLALECVGT
ncbi:hypothetical protein HU200_039063 [Digitaria exilis]|uniref:Protein kinase domain-containing protein n=1 Tax=Digitaria exilis TaxID=1010633 RepID=A0A835BDA4_9POAL|nr:hypothetical protein HU200_039063 [Digitaria exilis]